MKFRNLLLVFALGILIGAVVVRLFGEPRTASLPDAAKSLDPPELSPPPMARVPQADRPTERASASRRPAPPKPAEVKQAQAPYSTAPAKPLIQEAEKSHSFDDGSLERAGCFSSDDIAWIRMRWDEFDEERRVLVDQVNRGEQDWDGADWIELKRTLRENLGNARYDGLLFATDQRNSVRVSVLPRGSRAAEAGVRRGDRVLSYNGVQVYEDRALKMLALSESFERLVPIEVRHPGGTVEALVIEPGSLGAHFVGEKVSPCRDRDL